MGIQYVNDVIFKHQLLVFIDASIVNKWIQNQKTKPDVLSSSSCSGRMEWVIFVLKCSHRNGGSQLAPLIGKYCGTTIPTVIPSVSNQLFLRFVSDSSGRRKGFRITWDGTATGMWNKQQEIPNWVVIPYTQNE